MFSLSFQDSFLVSQKTSSICTKEWVGPALWGPYTILSASNNFLISFLSAKDCISSAFFLSQETCGRRAGWMRMLSLLTLNFQYAQTSDKDILKQKVLQTFDEGVTAFRDVLKFWTQILNVVTVDRQ